jgi:hypothetical protein
MGLMDNIKKAQDAAQQAMQQGGAGSMSPSGADVEYAQRAMKLNENGLPGTATINSITESGEGSDPVNKAYEIAISVELENGQSYDTSVFQYLTQDAVNAYQPGGKVQIKADPDDTSKVMIYGQA